MKEQTRWFVWSLLVSLIGCTAPEPEIRSVCLREAIGNYIVKWETNPKLEGMVKIFVADAPDAFEEASPALKVPINDGVVTFITSDNITRKYFRLLFNNRYEQVVGARTIVMDSVQNLRDLGGYACTNRRQQTRWGRLFRSGQLTALSDRDSLRLDKLHLKTILDLRSDYELELFPTHYRNARIVRAPMQTGDLPEMQHRIQENRIRKGDAALYMQDLYLQYVTGNQASLRRAFETLCDSTNYPVLIQCTLGKDRTGFLTALLLRILHMPEETVLKDYLLSNDCIQTQQVAGFVSQYSIDSQEAVTMMLSAQEEFLAIAFEKIEKDYGSVERYLAVELQLDENALRQLRDNLLTP